MTMNMIKSITIELQPGADIGDMIKRAWHLSDEMQIPVKFKHNGRLITVQGIGVIVKAKNKKEFELVKGWTQSVSPYFQVVRAK